MGSVAMAAGGGVASRVVTNYASPHIPMIKDNAKLAPLPNVIVAAAAMAMGKGKADPFAYGMIGAMSADLAGNYVSKLSNKADGVNEDIQGMAEELADEFEERLREDLSEDAASASQATNDDVSDDVSDASGSVNDEVSEEMNEEQY